VGKDLKKIVVSAVNFTEGGPLSILKECLEYLSSDLAGSYEIIVLVNDERLFNYKNIKFYSFPRAKKSWLLRLYYEYIYFLSFSKKLKPFLWLSLHDITPNVKADIRAVYCHNPSPFYKLSFKDAFLAPKFALFNLLYRYLYSLNIKMNNFVIVQQDCLRNKFRRLTKMGQIIVAHPQTVLGVSSEKQVYPALESSTTFFYPAFPRVFKNFEVICKASEILLKEGVCNFQVKFTISGDENRYSRHIFNSFRHIKNIKFLGIQSRDAVFDLYNSANCAIFPSKLETWGLPITEFKKYNKPILLADLPYAHETLGVYDKAIFFHPDNHEQLADAMKGLINRTAVFEKTEANAIPYPFAQNWKELFDILLYRKPAIPLK
jgi:glycosyltransferase involved in cell wall biosynthesis